MRSGTFLGSCNLAPAVYERVPNTASDAAPTIYTGTPLCFLCSWRMSDQAAWHSKVQHIRLRTCSLLETEVDHISFRRFEQDNFLGTLPVSAFADLLGPSSHFKIAHPKDPTASQDSTLPRTLRLRFREEPCLEFAEVYLLATKASRGRDIRRTNTFSSTKASKCRRCPRSR